MHCDATRGCGVAVPAYFGDATTTQFTFGPFTSNYSVGYKWALGTTSVGSGVRATRQLPPLTP